MNVKSIERKGNEATVVVEIDKELMESGVNKAYMKARKSIQLPGFRKGKAPRKMIEAMYGAHVFYEDGLEEIFPEIYDFAIAKQDFKAIGRPNLVKADWMAPGATVIDVGMNRDENGRLCGDVDYAEVEPVAGAITPVPGGVGPMTRAMLMLNTVTAAERLAGMATAWPR